MTDTLAQLIDKIELAYNNQSDVVVDPATARRLIAEEIGTAVALHLIGRETIVTGTSATGGAVTGTGIVQ